MTVSIIVAMSENRVIGLNNRLLWHLPVDMKHFKETTYGHHVIMGRKTYESFNVPLKGRVNIVITRNRNYIQEGIVVVHSLDDALEFAKKAGEEEVFIIGGGEIYKLGLTATDRIYLTIVHAELQGDTRFPELNMSEWKEVSKREYPADERHAHSFSIITLQR